MSHIPHPQQMYLQKNGMQRALSADSFSNSHPISSEANNPASIAEMFDAISYRKVCFSWYFRFSQLFIRFVFDGSTDSPNSA